MFVRRIQAAICLKNWTVSIRLTVFSQANINYQTFQVSVNGKLRLKFLIRFLYSNSQTDNAHLFIQHSIRTDFLTLISSLFIRNSLQYRKKWPLLKLLNTCCQSSRLQSNHQIISLLKMKRFRSLFELNIHMANHFGEQLLYPFSMKIWSDLVFIFPNHPNQLWQ